MPRPKLSFEYSLIHHYELRDYERDRRYIARSRVESLFRLRWVTVEGLMEGDLTPGSFLFLGLWHKRAAHGLGLWGMGQRRTGELDCARWRIFRLTEPGERVRKSDARRAVRQRLLAFPGNLNGRRITDLADVRELRAAEVFYD